MLHLSLTVRPNNACQVEVEFIIMLEMEFAGTDCPEKLWMPGSEQPGQVEGVSACGRGAVARCSLSLCDQI